MSASPPKADVAQHRPQVRFVPFADIACRRLLVVDRRINLAVDFANIARFDEPAFVLLTRPTKNVCAAFASPTVYQRWLATQCERQNRAARQVMPTAFRHELG
jgi:hypothetical protein